MYYLPLSVVDAQTGVGPRRQRDEGVMVPPVRVVDDARSARSDVCLHLRVEPVPFPRRQPGVAPRLPHEGLADDEGWPCHELAPLSAVLRQGRPLVESRWVDFFKAES